MNRHGCELYEEGAQRAASRNVSSVALSTGSGLKARGDQRLTNCGSIGWSALRGLGVVMMGSRSQVAHWLVSQQSREGNGNGTVKSLSGSVRIKQLRERV